MLEITNGTRHTLGQKTTGTRVTFDEQLRPHLKKFYNGKNLNAWAVFSAIALSANDQGVAQLSLHDFRVLTGIKHNKTIVDAINHLKSITIEDRRLVAQETMRLTEGKEALASSVYRILPDAEVVESEGAQKIPPPHMVVRSSHKGSAINAQPLSDLVRLSHNPPLKLLTAGSSQPAPEVAVSEPVASRARTHAHTRTRLDSDSSSGSSSESLKESIPAPADFAQGDPTPSEPTPTPLNVGSGDHSALARSEKDSAQPDSVPTTTKPAPSLGTAEGAGNNADKANLEDILDPGDIRDHPMHGLAKLSFFPVKDDERKVWDRAFTPAEAKQKRAELEAKGYRLVRGRDLLTAEFAAYALQHFKVKRERSLAFDAIAETQFNMKPGFNPDALNGSKGQVGAVVSAFAALFEIPVGVLNRDAKRAAEIRKCLNDYTASGHTIQMRRPEAYISWWGRWEAAGRRPIPVKEKEPKELSAGDIYGPVHSHPYDDPPF